MYTGVQFTGTLTAGQSRRWFTWGWTASKHVVWYMMPTTPRSGAPELNWTVEVERADANACTYWLTVKNLTPVSVTFEGRYAVLN
ncbi:MAG TPA: hypothetical protein VK919_12645 [Solirubrobacterales bacterium]|nr:hypothetical protein [Solirubrobacterales bacterium]